MNELSQWMIIRILVQNHHIVIISRFLRGIAINVMNVNMSFIHVINFFAVSLSCIIVLYHLPNLFLYTCDRLSSFKLKTILIIQLRLRL